MRVGLIGLRSSGKTTIFRMLTGQEPHGTAHPAGRRQDVHLGVIRVPDARVDRVAGIFRPKKTVHAEIHFIDFPPPEGKEHAKEDRDFYPQMREVDAFAAVLRDFLPDVDPLKELGDLLTDMILADLEVVEKRLAKMRKEKGKEKEIALLERCSKALESEQGLRTLSLLPDEENLLSGYGFLGRKPVLAVFNTGEDRAGKPLPLAYGEALRERGVEGMAVAGELEMEIAQLDEQDRKAFLEEMGLKESARDRFIRACFNLLDLISFFTTVSDEVRAWTVKRGTTARTAAGKIHSDMGRGFIRAEVVSYKDFISLGSEAKCRESGKLRLEGKDYLVQDGDIIRFRFNV